VQTLFTSQCHQYSRSTLFFSFFFFKFAAMGGGVQPCVKQPVKGLSLVIL